MVEGKKETEPVARDLFSEIPDTIFHQILSLLPTIHVIRMSLVSKRWRQMCQTVPVLSFSDYDFDLNISSESLCGFVSNCLRLRVADVVASGNAPVTKFKLDTGSCDYFNVDDWMGLIAESKVKELYLSVWWMDDPYIIPPDILCMRSLTHLKLYLVEFDSELPLISLPNLTSLNLDVISITDETLDELLLGCPSLEKLVLDSYSGLIYPIILSPSLKDLYFSVREDEDEDEKDQVLQIDAMNLESINFSGSEICFRSNMLFCRSLILTSFYTGERDDQWLEDIICRLPCLESLYLDVSDLRYGKICSQNLRRLTMSITRDGETEFFIDAPKLVYFSFSGIPPVDVSMNVPNLLEPNLKLYYSERYKFTFHTNLIYFLSKLDCCSRSLVLGVCSEEALIIPYKLRDICKPPLPSVKHITLLTCGPLLRSKELNESLLWMVPSQETLTIDEKKGCGF